MTASLTSLPEPCPSSMVASDMDVDERLRSLVALHGHPEYGSPYWIRRQHQLGIDLRDQIRSMADVPTLGLVDPRSFAAHSVWDFVPRAWKPRPRDMVIAETGGTTGDPSPVVYREADFEAGFVTPFVTVARHLHFPMAAEWLFVGPSGPHIIGRAARTVAARMESPDPWMVDFDPRWAKKLPADSLAASRYRDHVAHQAVTILRREQIGVLFTTPPILHALIAATSLRQREAIRAVHYGGVAIDATELDHFRDAYPQAIHVAGYGNTLFGCAMEVADGPREGMDYFPHGPRLHFTVLAEGASTPSSTPGARGRVVFHRLDESMLLLGVLERDHAELIIPPEPARTLGFVHVGLRDPSPPAATRSHVKVGLY